MTKTIEQQRAAAAWDHVGSKHDEKYEKLVQGTPTHVHTAGLGQTVAFYLSRKRQSNPEYHKLLTHLATWLLRAPGSDVPDLAKTPDDLMTDIQGGDTESYRRRTSEALAYLGWLKRFAAARAPVETANP